MKTGITFAVGLWHLDSNFLPLWADETDSEAASKGTKDIKKLQQTAAMSIRGPMWKAITTRHK